MFLILGLTQSRELKTVEHSYKLSSEIIIAIGKAVSLTRGRAQSSIALLRASSSHQQP